MATSRARAGGDSLGKAETDEVTAGMGKLDLRKTTPTSQLPATHPVDTPGCRFVYFDLKTTGLGKNCNITQIAALESDQDYFHLPKATTTTKENFETFIKFLKGEKKVVLLAHNALRFGCPRLVKALEEHGLVEEFQKNVLGFVDTYVLFKSKRTDLKTWTLPSLYKAYHIDDEFPPFDAMKNVQALQKIVYVANVTPDDREYTQSFYKFEGVIQRYMKAKQQQPAQKLMTGTIMKDKKPMPFESVFTWEDVLQTFNDNGKDATKQMLKDEVVKMVDGIIDNICEHLQPLTEADNP